MKACARNLTRLREWTLKSVSPLGLAALKLPVRAQKHEKILMIKLQQKYHAQFLCPFL
jgi:hypothetical protein